MRNTEPTAKEPTVVPTEAMPEPQATLLALEELRTKPAGKRGKAGRRQRDTRGAPMRVAMSVRAETSQGDKAVVPRALAVLLVQWVEVTQLAVLRL